VVVSTLRRRSGSVIALLGLPSLVDHLIDMPERPNRPHH
jgi:hypothetical protein